MKLIRTLIVLAIGIAIGYFLTPTIDNLLKKQDTVSVEKLEVIKETLNDNNVGDSIPNVDEESE